jgi:hypothetical protein
MPLAIVRESEELTLCLHEVSRLRLSEGFTEGDQDLVPQIWGRSRQSELHGFGDRPFEVPL